MSDNRIKSADLCERCKYSEELCEPLNSCDNCKQRSVHPAGIPLCKCDGIRTGTPCPDFEEAEA